MPISHSRQRTDLLQTQHTGSNEKERGRRNGSVEWSNLNSGTEGKIQGYIRENTGIHSKGSIASQGRKVNHSRSGWTPWQRLYDNIPAATADANIREGRK